MIQPNPDYLHLFAERRCPQREQAESMRTALVLLTRSSRTASDDRELHKAALMAWESARLAGCTRGSIGAGLLLAQVQLALGQAQAAAVTAQRVQTLARGTPEAALTCVRAMRLGIEAWRRLGKNDTADHLLGLAMLVAESLRDQAQRIRARNLLQTASPSASPSPKRE